ncbi:MAG: HAD-IA family hydrolase, partial [Lachnospiraceae bacterium]
KRYGFDDETIAFLVKKYRERFNKIGVFENELYPGVKEALASLQDRGYALVLASSKPEDACRIILEHHGILSYFTEVVGATLDSRISSKKEVLEEVLRRMDIQNPKECILIGDTIYDVEGAKDIGMDCIGVSYGFGRVEELERAGAYCICKDLEEVVRSIERYQVI